MYTLKDLLDIMQRLREPEGGCPWDLRQDFRSIAPYTIEEAYEVADVIEREAWDELCGELGDLLLQVVYHAQMAKEKEWFGFEQVVEAICTKMVQRHPHVFGDAGPRADEEIVAHWEESKRTERKARGHDGVLTGIPKALPALNRAAKLQKRAAHAGFDWSEAAPVLDKLAEELQELREARSAEAREHEIGDLLFSVVNYARHCKIRPEEAMHRTCERFSRRFEHMERVLEQAGEAPQACTQERWEQLWQAAKRAEG